MTALTRETLDRLSELMGKATPQAPWTPVADMFNGKEELWGRFHGINGVNDLYFDGDMVGPNCAFICALVNAAPALIASARASVGAREDVARYGVHLPGCEVHRTGYNDMTVCDCGFSEALHAAMGAKS